MFPPAGVIEGFFGPSWSWPERAQLAGLLKSYPQSFYLYAPKRDPYLRKLWSSPYPQHGFDQLTQLKNVFAENGVGFGVGLSPFGLNEGWSNKLKLALKQKLKELKTLKLDYLGLFFDDMKSHPDLLSNQLKALEIVASEISARILFCPTYYSDDPILEKVFGPCPKGYLEGLAREVDPSIDLMWTGPKVISPEISSEHLQQVTEKLNRPPFIWDNIFANDGPRQCKFLKLTAFHGRRAESLAETSGWCLNPMNQAALSRIVVASAFQVFGLGEKSASKKPEQALLDQIRKLAGRDFSKWWSNHSGAFLEQGLDHLNVSSLLDCSNEKENVYCSEIVKFLHGDYVVGPECLTD